MSEDGPDGDAGEDLDPDVEDLFASDPGDGSSGTDATGGEGDTETGSADGSPATEGTTGRTLPAPSKFLLALVAGVAGLAGTYGVAGNGRGFLLAPFADLLTRYTPAIVFRFFRNETGELLQKLLSAGLAVAFLAVLAIAALYVADRLGHRWTGAPLAGLLAGIGTYLAVSTPLAALAAAIGVGIVVGLAESAAGWPSRPPTTSGRRRILVGLGSAIGIALLGGTLGDRLAAGSGTATGSGPAGSGSAVDRATDGDQENRLPGVDRSRIESLLTEAEEKSLDLPGTEPLVSQNFYAVDINQVDPEVNADDWTLSVTGEVGSERTVDYREIREMDSQNRFVTLRCVSDAVGGDAIDNALWTGVPASRVLEGTDPQGEYVLLHAADGYSVGFPLAALQQGFLAYGMNGNALPRAHGYPVRALIPGHWGETNVKWITEIEVTSELQDGYWESRGWQGTGPVHTVAKISSVDQGDDRIAVGGHAYAGTRGISGVEVSTDGGDTWQAAELSEALPGEDVWRQWRFEYDSPGESHEVVARAIEADGTVQTEEVDDAYPGGATGYHRRTIQG